MNRGHIEFTYFKTPTHYPSTECIDLFEFKKDGDGPTKYIKFYKNKLLHIKNINDISIFIFACNENSEFDVDILIKTIGHDILHQYLKYVSYAPNHRAGCIHITMIQSIMKLLTTTRPTLHKITLSYPLGYTTIKRICKSVTIHELCLYYTGNVNLINIPQVKIITLCDGKSWNTDEIVGAIGKKYFIMSDSIERMARLSCWKYVETLKLNMKIIWSGDLQILKNTSIYEIVRSNYDPRRDKLFDIMSLHRIILPIKSRYGKNPIMKYYHCRKVQMRNMIIDIQPELADIIDDYYQMDF
jgi:hypothetical protein